MAIGISPGGGAARGAGVEFARLPAASSRGPAGLREPRSDAPPAGTAPGDGGLPGAGDRETRIARVERIGAAAPAGTARGISAYLEVERGAVSEVAGGELVGIDFYV